MQEAPFEAQQTDLSGLFGNEQTNTFYSPIQPTQEGLSLEASAFGTDTTANVRPPFYPSLKGPLTPSQAFTEHSQLSGVQTYETSGVESLGLGNGGQDLQFWFPESFPAIPDMYTQPITTASNVAPTHSRQVQNATSSLGQSQASASHNMAMSAPPGFYFQLPPSTLSTLVPVAYSQSLHYPYLQAGWYHVLRDAMKKMSTTLDNTAVTIASSGSAVNLIDRLYMPLDSHAQPGQELSRTPDDFLEYVDRYSRRQAESPGYTSTWSGSDCALYCRIGMAAAFYTVEKLLNNSEVKILCSQNAASSLEGSLYCPVTSVTELASLIRQLMHDNTLQAGLDIRPKVIMDYLRSGWQ